MNYKDIDAEIQRKIISALLERQKINLNKEIGKAYMQAEEEDKIQPSVIINREELKILTGREKLRDQVWDDYAAALKRPWLNIEKPDSDSLKISVVPLRLKENEFVSLSAITQKNDIEVAENPELGEDPY